MAHRTLIGGTGYTVTGGTDLIAGTAYSRRAGRALIDGTARTIGFGGLDPAFSKNSWATIIAACQNKEVPDTWNVGDSCNMTINNKTYQIDIIGKNHDDYADGSGKAPLTFQMHDCYATAYKMNSDGPYNRLGWETSYVREDTACPTIKKKMPAEVRAALKAVTKKTSEGSSSSAIVTTQDTLFCLSEIEVFGTRTYSYAGEGTQYAYYKGKTAAEIAKKRSGDIESWWLRSPKSYDTKNYCIVHWDGEADYYTADSNCGVAAAFCF